MKRGFIITIALALTCMEAFAQHAVYTHQNMRILYHEKVRLVANISSFHHLLVFRYGKKPLLSIYNHLLSLKIKKELPFAIADDNEVQVLPHQDFYYISAYAQKLKKYGLWKIDAAGNCTDMRASLRNLTHTQFKDTNTNLRIIPYGNRSYVMTDIYYPHIGSAITTQVLADSLLQPVETRKVMYPFKGERLEQVLQSGEDNLMVLTTGRDEEENGFLKLRKINTKTGHAIETNFRIGLNSFVKPQLDINEKDTTVFLYSLINPYGGRRSDQVFLCRLSDSLKELAPPKLQRVSIPNHVMFIDVLYQQLVCLSGFTQDRYRLTPTNNITDRWSSGRTTYNDNAELVYRLAAPYINYNQYYRPQRIRLSLLDDQLRTLKDSIVPNDKRKYTILTDEYATFTFENRIFLLLKHQFAAKSKGLLLLYSKSGAQIETSDVRVYDRYDYSLSQLQQTPDGSLLIPFVHRQEAGLIKLKIDQDIFASPN